MYCKTCPACGRKSYSAATIGKWVCPYCENDLTQYELMPIRETPPAELKLININEKKDKYIPK